MPTAQDKYTGSIFDNLDKAVAARAGDLMKRPSIAKQTYDEWRTDLSQLESYAMQYSSVGYVTKQWNSEQPRYVLIDAALQSKVVIADPTNYNTRISISGGGCCSDCSKVPQLPGYTPGVYGSGGYGAGGGLGTSFFSGDTNFNPSLGDGIRGTAIPLQAYPDAQQGEGLIDKSSFWTQILVAVVLGAAIWGIHYATKKKVI